MKLSVMLFGRFTVWIDDDPPLTLSARAQELLVYLLLFKRRYHSRDAIATQLWGECSPSLARKYLRQTLWQLTTSLSGNTASGEQHPFVLADKSAIYLNPEASIWVDVAALKSQYREVQNLKGEMLEETQIDEVKRALAFCESELLATWHQEWCILERERLQVIGRSLMDKMIAYSLHRGEIDQGIAYCMRLLRDEPVREKTYRQLMRLYYLGNDRSTALGQYKNCQRILKKELDVSPTEVTTQLYNHILHDEGPMYPEALSFRPPHELPRKLALGPRLADTLNNILDDLDSLRADMDVIKQALVRQGEKTTQRRTERRIKDAPKDVIKMAG